MRKGETLLDPLFPKWLLVLMKIEGSRKPLNITEINYDLKICRITIVASIKMLEDLKYIEQNKKMSDDRAKFYESTKKGVELCKKFYGIKEEITKWQESTKV